ncbi:hypothetical protein B0H17DRAFT_1212874 [Mycena rosella]|uniref:MYND-type domain-containing protein n=1 Tax=Mycena rosella TaxID=1033263 RepID=A0AAD7G4S3_MYCRO|nr:hypothetical protein B0H17DRAFT_1212874 [Mycena rosella]
MARKQLTLIPEALVDITSPLTSDPDNIDAKAEFRTLVDMQNKTGIQRRFTPEDLLEGTSPSAHGSLLLNPVRMDRDDPHHMKLPFFKTATFPPSTTHVANIHGACHACRTPKHRKDLKTCKKCFRVNYFSVECQRAEWPEHKLTCKPARDDNLTIRVGRRLADHPYFKTLLLLYALRAMGPARLPEEDHDLILMVVVDMLPLLGSAHPGRQHIVVKNILAVPTCIVPEEVAYVQRAALDDGPRGLRVHCVWIATTGIYPDGEESRFRLILLPAADIMVSSAHLPNFSLDLYSHSHGVFRRVSLDVDFIFESLNDELRLDIDNYYQLQG